MTKTLGKGVKTLKALHVVTFILLVVGGLNWLLVGLFGWDISKFLGGMNATVPKVIYILVGLSALVEIFTHSKNCKHCETRPVPSQPTV